MARLARIVAGDRAAVGHSDDGAPYLTGYDGYISVSHSRLMAFMALHRSLRIGIDAELPRGQLMKVAERFLAPDERLLWRSQSALLRAWTIKEAVYKAAGVAGLGVGRHTSAPPFPDAWSAVCRDSRRTPVRALRPRH